MKLWQLVLTILVVIGCCMCHSDKRIVGGRVVTIDEFPFQVSIRRTHNDAHFCGGTIITPKHVLTAAHCCYYKWGALLPPFEIRILAGQANGNRNSTSISEIAEEIYVHPEYDENTMSNDLAIIVLKNELPLNGRNLDKIRLNSNSIGVNTKCAVSGWGVLEHGTYEISNQLLATSVYTLDFSECQKRYRAINTPLQNGMLCAVNDYQPADSCQGDSGGPLVCNDVLTGIISTGKGCANKRFPGIYTDVKYFLPWIQQQITPEVENTVAITTVTTPVKPNGNLLVLLFNLFSSGLLKNLSLTAIFAVFAQHVLFQN